MIESWTRYVTLSACAAVVLLTGAAAFMLSAPALDAHAQSGAKKAAKGQSATKSETVTLTEDTDDPAVWGKVFPLHYELSACAPCGKAIPSASISVKSAATLTC
jgi:hypothetical protein